MINDETLIKIARSRGHRFDWPEIVRNMKNRIWELKLGFPGIENNHLSIVPFSEIVRGDMFIWDIFLESRERGDEAPILFKVQEDGNYLIEGIGCGYDLHRDPRRTNYRWRDIVSPPEISGNSLVCRVDVRPTMDGGPGYYYFYKSYRDFRY